MEKSQNETSWNQNTEEKQCLYFFIEIIDLMLVFPYLTNSVNRPLIQEVECL